jgi:hypothetical protein
MKRLCASPEFEDHWMIRRFGLLFIFRWTGAEKELSRDSGVNQ